MPVLPGRPCWVYRMPLEALSTCKTTPAVNCAVCRICFHHVRQLAVFAYPRTQGNNPIAYELVPRSRLHKTKGPEMMILLQRRRSEDWGVASVFETARMPAMKRQLSVPERDGWLHWRFRKTFLLSGAAVLWHL